MITFLFFSANKMPQGLYVKKGKDYCYSLTLNKNDSTFSFSIESIHARSGCKGNWYIVSDTLFLECENEPFPAQLTRGYMSDREKKIIILNDKKLKLDEVVMKRTKKN